MFVGSVSGSFQGPTQIEAHRRAAPRGVQQQGDLRRRTGARGRPPTSCASGSSTSSPASSTSIRSTSVAATTSQRDEPPLAMLTGQPFLGVTTQEQIEQAARIVDWDELPATPGRRPRREGRYLGLGIAVVPRGGAGAEDPRPGGHGRRDHGQRGQPTSRSRTTAAIAHHHPAAPHGQGHETTLAQVAVDELGVPFEDVNVVLTATPTSRRSRWSPPVAAGRRPWRTASVLHASRELREQILATRRRPARGQRRRPRDPRRRRSACGARPSIQLPLRELARIVAEEPERLPGGHRHRPRW